MIKMNEEKFSKLMYYLTKNAARISFIDFLSSIGLTEDDYEEIKQYLKENYNVKTYV
jgi:hypothetical protein